MKITKRYNIIRIWRPVNESGSFLEPHFEIVGQFGGYTTKEEAALDRLKLPNADRCVVMKIWW